MKQILAIVIIGAALVSCSSDDGSGTDAGGSTAPSSSVSSASPSSSVSDVTISTSPETVPAGDVETRLVTLSDFPDDWVEVPVGESSDTDVAIQQQNAECVGGDGDRLLDLGGPVATSNDFIGPDGLSVTQTVTTVDEAVAVDFMTRFSAPEAADCFGQNLADSAQALLDAAGETNSLPSDSSIGDIVVEPLEVAAAGDETIAYRVTIPLTADGEVSDNHFDILAVRAGGTLGGFVVSSVGTPPTMEQIDEIVETAVAVIGS